jgi:hypothetical protein
MSISSCFDIGFSLTRGFGALSTEEKQMVMGSLCSAPAELHREAERAVASGDDELEVRRAVTMTAYLMSVVHAILRARPLRVCCRPRV